MGDDERALVAYEEYLSLLGAPESSEPDARDARQKIRQLKVRKAAKGREGRGQKAGDKRPEKAGDRPTPQKAGDRPTPGAERGRRKATGLMIWRGEELEAG
jgi:hypothetical protein